MCARSRSSRGRPARIAGAIRDSGEGRGGDVVPDLVGERVPDVLVGILDREESAGRSQDGWGCSD